MSICLQVVRCNWQHEILCAQSRVDMKSDLVHDLDRLISSRLADPPEIKRTGHGIGGNLPIITVPLCDWILIQGALTHLGPDQQLTFHRLYGQIIPNTVTHPLLVRQISQSFSANYVHSACSGPKASRKPWCTNRLWSEHGVSDLY